MGDPPFFVILSCNHVVDSLSYLGFSIVLALRQYALYEWNHLSVSINAQTGLHLSLRHI